KSAVIEKKVAFLYNKKNKLNESMKHNNHYIGNKRKKSYNRKKSMYIESLDEKLQIILQRLDKIEANRSRDWERDT
ncbi:11974_t:CDS:1, partial [Gigaspora margarita]